MREFLGWGAGVGWDVNVHFNFNYIVRSLALPHIGRATLLDVAHNRGESEAVAYTQRLQTRLHEILEVLVCCSLAQKRDRQCPPQTRTTLCLNEKTNFSAEHSIYKIAVSLR